MSDTPVRTGWLELQGGIDSTVGVFGRAEAGYRPYESLALFGFGQIDKLGTQVGAGVRLKF